MMQSAKLMAFVSTRNPQKAKAFYSGILGLRFTSEHPFAVVFDSQGVMLRISIVKDLTPQPFTVLGWQVPDIRATIHELGRKGVSFERSDFIPQDADGIWITDDGTQVAWFKDPDGNLLSLTQFPIQ